MTTTPDTEEEDEVCGESYDHDLDVHYEDEDMRILWCGNCGAEIIEDRDDA